MNDTHPDAGYGLFLLLIILAAYMLPTIVAFVRGHHQRVAILLTNLLLGWTALGWIAALIWSATAKREPTPQWEKRIMTRDPADWQRPGNVENWREQIK